MDIEIVAPRLDDNGIIFYVSADGNQTGISVSGLEKLLGFQQHSALFIEKRFKFLYRMSTNAPLLKTDSKWLLPAWGKVFTPLLKGTDGARIIDSKAAVCIIKHYAFENKSEIALNSLDKFIEIGFSTWVKKTVGFAAEPTANSQLLEMLKLMNDKLETVSAKVTKWDRIEGISATVYPGLSLLNDSLSQDSAQKSLPSSTLYTIEDWLQIKGVVLDKRTFWQFVRLASDTYLSLTGERPKIKYAKDSKGKYQKKANGYRLVDFNVLETAWSSLTESNK